MSRALRGVVVAISAFRSDSQIIDLLGRIFADGADDFAAIIIVDSLADGTLQQEIARAGWRVRYENAATNLGSAGNLARRLQLAAATDADWCFAINADGMFDRELIAKLVAKGGKDERVGAVFPRRIWTDRGGSWLRPHRSIFTMPRHSDGDDPVPDDEVAWDSSNGALYALAPIRDGLNVMGDLWMGWEDLAYGWTLQRNGWRQLLCTEAEYHDDYEYQPVRAFGRTHYITRKPSWYAYYVIRNAILIVQRSAGGAAGWRFVANRLMREILFTGLFRQNKMQRFRMLALGFAHGLAGRTGKGPVP